jgi:probable rRNA maturation factor
MQYELHKTVPFRIVSQALVDRIFHAAEQVVDIPKEFHFSIAVVSDQTMHDLNRTYRKKDKPTDVLAFRYDDSSGEIVLSADRLRAQAKMYGHTVTVETAYMLVHGILHILGWDHESDSEENDMKSKEYAILQLCTLAFAR